jgi:hypothetical protein
MMIPQTLLAGAGAIGLMTGHRVGKDGCR